MSDSGECAHGILYENECSKCWSEHRARIDFIEANKLIHPELVSHLSRMHIRKRPETTNSREWVEITDAIELQNLLDDFGPLRPTLNTYCDSPIEIYARKVELEEWRNSSVRVHRSSDKEYLEELFKSLLMLRGLRQSD